MKSLDDIASTFSTIEIGLLSKARYINSLERRFRSSLISTVSFLDLAEVGFRTGRVNYAQDLKGAEFYVSSVIEEEHLPDAVIELNEAHSRQVRSEMDDSYLLSLARADTMFDLASRFRFKRMFGDSHSAFGRYVLHLINPEELVDEFRLSRAGVDYYADQRVLSFSAYRDVYNYLRRQYRQEARDVYSMPVPHDGIEKEMFARAFVAWRMSEECGIDRDDAKELVMFDLMLEIRRSYDISLSVLGTSASRGAEDYGSFFYREDMLSH